jgi:hypothetical protein
MLSTSHQTLHKRMLSACADERRILDDWRGAMGWKWIGAMGWKWIDGGEMEEEWTVEVVDQVVEGTKTLSLALGRTVERE